MPRLLPFAPIFLLFVALVSRGEAAALRLNAPMQFPVPRAPAMLNAQIVLANAIKQTLDDRNSVAVRTNALNRLSLEDFKAMAPVFNELLAGSATEPVGLACLAALNRYSDPGVMRLVAENWSNLTPRLKETALQMALLSVERLRILLECLQPGRISAEEVEPRLRERMLRHLDATVARRARLLFNPGVVRTTGVNQQKPASF